eukprot:GHVH01005502.1.p1 GENE.GHVH01005502.1~~GHVH01005502.1.p1  ORF type:complete len:179 (-),score=10.39 GHVH01005502.1:1272-1808(-)
MFQNVIHGDFVSLLCASESKPMQMWSRVVENGIIRRVHDDDVSSPVVELIASDISRCIIRCPHENSLSLGIKLPILGLIVKNMDENFAFEVTLLDSHGITRRLRASNFLLEATVKPYICHLPLKLDLGWTYVQMNLDDICHHAYKITFVRNRLLMCKYMQIVDCSVCSFLIPCYLNMN